MKKFIFLTLVLFTQIALADKTISKNTIECVENDETLQDRLTSYSKFRNIDDSNWVAAFHQVNLIFSEVKYTKGSKKGIFFAIQPLPILKDSYPIDRTLYPKFTAECETKQDPLSLTCKQIPTSDQFVVRDFSLSVTFAQNGGCSSNKQQSLQYSIAINDAEFNQIKQALIKQGIPQATINEFTQVEKLLGTYWKNFFEAWNDNDWLN